MTVREDIATAGSSVDGINGHPYFVQGSHAGHSFLRLDRVEYPNPFGGVAFWNFIVILPQDPALAERYIEEKVPLLKTAIEPFLHITEAVPQRLNTGTGDLLCVFLNGHREE